MRRKGRTFSAGSKARVALEAVRGTKGPDQIAREQGVLPGQVAAWRKEALEGLGRAFGGRDPVAGEPGEARKRNAVPGGKIGQLAVEAEFPGKKCVHPGVGPGEKP